MLIKEFYTDKLYTRIFDTREAMGQCAGEEIAQKLRELLASRDQVNIMFGAAPSQNETLATLVSAEGIDWSRVNAFHMDEYVGLPQNILLASETILTGIYSHCCLSAVSIL